MYIHIYIVTYFIRILINYVPTKIYQITSPCHHIILTLHLF